MAIAPCNGRIIFQQITVMRLKLSVKIVLSILITIVIILTSGFYIVVKEARKSIISDLRQQANVLGDLVQEDVTDAFIEINDETFLLQELVEQAKLFENILWVEIFNREAVVIAHSIKERVGHPPLPIHEKYVKNVMKNGLPITEEDQGRQRFDKFLPLKKGKKEKEEIIGVAEFVMTLKPGNHDPEKKIDAIAAIMLPVAQGMLAELQNAIAYIQDLTEHLGTLSTIKNVEIINLDNMIIAHTEKEQTGRKTDRLNEEYIKKVLTTKESFIEEAFDKDRYIRFMPYFKDAVNGERHLGGVILMGMDLEPVKRQLNVLERRFFTVGFIITAGISIILILLLRRTVLLPVFRLTSAVKDMTAGNLNRQVKIRSTDELGQLGEAFNEMSQDLKRSRESLVQSEQNLKEAQKIAHLGHWMYTIAEKRLYWSEELYNILELDERHNSPSYETFYEIIHPKDRKLVKSYHEKYLTEKKSFDFDHRLLMKDGRIKYINEKFRLEFDSEGNPLRSFGTILDITRQKEAESLVLKAKEEADIAHRAKTEFLANMSHEIRTPMTSIIGAAEMLLLKERDEKEKELIEHLVRSTNILLTLINDLIDLSHLEAGNVNLKELDFNIKEELGKVIDIYHKVTEEKGIKMLCEIDPHLPPAVKGDAVRLRQILLNLLGNAVKFTHEGEISVKADCPHKLLPSEDINVLFSVKDTGIGIEKEKLEMIFEQFSQVDGSSTRLYGGTGLGLSIVKRLVEIMGGEICVESKKGEGTVFSLRIPFKVV